MSKKIDDVVAAYVAENVAWSGERSQRVFEGAMRGHRRRVAQKRWLRTAAATFASAAAFAAMIHSASAARSMAPHAARSEAIEVERLAFADGALADGGYEAAVR